MDEVLVQFVQAVLNRWNAMNGTDIQHREVNVWRMEAILGMAHDGRPAEGMIDEWMSEKGFFLALEPIPGAIDGFNALNDAGHELVIATSIPEAVHQNAFDDKRKWMRRHFPWFSMKNFIATSRKGLIQGDVLIDDGEHNIKDWVENHNPHWSPAVVYDAPWNRPTSQAQARVHGWRQILHLIDGYRYNREMDEKRAEWGVYA